MIDLGNPQIIDSEIEDFFSKGGTLSTKIPGFEERFGQIEMAKVVANNFNNGGISLIEAGTGIGKSYAYLYPAILKALNKELDENYTPTIIATSSITLQNQLYDKDIPNLLRYLDLEPGSIKYSLLLGRNNYLCYKRFKEYAENNALLIDLIKGFNDWIKTTTTGLKMEIQDTILNSDWNLVCSDSDYCVGFKRCRYSGLCYYFKAYKRAQEADVVITNQHVLALDSKIRAEKDEGYEVPCLLPPFNTLVIDEAHNFKEISRKILSEEFDCAGLKDALNLLFRKDKKLLVTTLELILQQFKREIELSAEVFNKDRKQILAKTAAVETEISELKGKKLLDNEFNFNPATVDKYSALFEKIKILLPLCEAHYKAVMDLQNRYAKLEVEENNYLSNLKFVCSKLDCSICAMKSILNLATSDNRIYYLEKDVIKIAPMNLGSFLSSNFFNLINSIVCCSATLTTNKNFEFFINTYNIRALCYTTNIFTSPFRYDEHMKILIPEDAIAYNVERDEEFQKYVTQQVRKAIIASSGGALVLFTSYSMMNKVYSTLRNENFKIFCQSKSSSKQELLNKFKENINSSLFGVASFWEGIDIPGNSLRLVIIVKLPFISPSDPIYNGMKLLCSPQNAWGLFNSYSIPSTIISTKQGIGRLIRNNEDRGIVVFLDNRLITKPYRFQIANSLPVSIEKVKDIESVISEFFEVF